jgi:hypothetical protein
MGFLFGEGEGFHKFLVMGKPNGPLPQMKKKAPSKNLCFGTHHNKLN